MHSFCISLAFLLPWLICVHAQCVGDSCDITDQRGPTNVLDSVINQVLLTTPSLITSIIATHTSALATQSPRISAVSSNGPDTEPRDASSEFESFEEWRHRNLLKSGQSGGELGEPRVAQIRQLGSPPSSSSENDGFLQDDLEINLEMFHPPSPPSDANINYEPYYDNDNTNNVAVHDEPGKVYKERFNYASFDCAATIVNTNKNTKGASNILSENKDTYMLNRCSESPKFVVVELCQDILVDTVALANYEFFSSMFRTIRISVSDVFPVPSNGWKVLGQFEAKSIRDLQTFHIENPLIWARYLRVEFLSHWGHEFYCPISLIRVHGTTMMDEYRSEEKKLHHRRENLDHILAASDLLKEQHGYNINDSGAIAQLAAKELPLTEQENEDRHAQKQLLELLREDEEKKKEREGGTEKERKVERKGADQVQNTDNDVHCEPVRSSSEATFGGDKRNGSILTYANLSSSSFSDALLFSRVNLSSSSLVFNESCMWEEYVRDSASQHRNHPTPQSQFSLNSQSFVSNFYPHTSSVAPLLYPQPHANSYGDYHPNASGVVPQSSGVRAQDSIYQTIMKRLSLLESNATLSLRYIEAQSQNVRELLGRIERKHSLKIDSFFRDLNSTVNNQIRSFQQQYARLLLSTVDELQAQRTQSELDMSILNARMSMLSDELMYQKKLGIAQALILLTILIFVIVTRGTTVDSYAIALQSGIRGPAAAGGLLSPSRPRSSVFAFGSSSPGSPGALWRRFSSYYNDYNDGDTFDRDDTNEEDQSGSTNDDDHSDGFHEVRFSEDEHGDLDDPDGALHEHHLESQQPDLDRKLNDTADNDVDGKGDYGERPLAINDSTNKITNLDLLDKVEPSHDRQTGLLRSLTT